MDDMTQPPELMLVQDRLHAADSYPFQHLCVWHFVYPGDAKDLLETPDVEGLQASEMVAVNGPCLTPIQ